jgi:hypothetical protein
MTDFNRETRQTGEPISHSYNIDNILRLSSSYHISTLAPPKRKPRQSTHMDSSRPHIIDFANRHEENATNAHPKASDVDHSEKQAQDTPPVEPIPRLRTFFAAHNSRLQAIQDACSAAQGAAADLELVLTALSARPGEPVRQVRSLFAGHDMNLEAVRIACECAQECSVELLQALEVFFADGDL